MPSRSMDDARAPYDAFSGAEAHLSLGEPGLIPGEAMNDAKAGARTPYDAFSGAEAHLSLGEPGLIPGEAMNDAKAGARTQTR